MVCPVTWQEVANVIGGEPAISDQDRLKSATEAACDWVWQTLDLPTIIDDEGNVWPPVWPTPCPDRWRQAIIGLALDLYRMPTAAFGYFANDLAIASVGNDPMRRWRLYLTDDKAGWGFA